MTTQSVIKPWLGTILIVGLLGATATSAYLILQLSHFDEAKKEAWDARSQVADLKTEIASLQTDLNTLVDRTNTLAPLVADWELRMKDKADAEAILAGFASKQKLAESDLGQTQTNLAQVSESVAELQKTKNELDASVNQLKAQLQTLNSSNVDLQSIWNQAMEAETRLNNATNKIAIAKERLQLLETSAEDAQTNLQRIGREITSLRQTRDGLTEDTATARQQLQSLKDQVDTIKPQIADIKAQQSAIQVGEGKLAALNESYAKLQEIKAELFADQLTMTTNLDSLKAEVDDNNKATAAAQAKLNSARTSLQKEEDNLASIRGSTETLEGRQNELTREVASLQTTKDNLEVEKNALESQIGSLEARVLNTNTVGQTNSAK